ncbi:hypothetical protein I317_05457 [Kwoniella heveanensis CBS 569]|nr:hypothetical protein I317_05457 [Kwoniella heveanensis CBS 569]
MKSSADKSSTSAPSREDENNVVASTSTSSSSPGSTIGAGAVTGTRHASGGGLSTLAETDVCPFPPKVFAQMQAKYAKVAEEL